MSRPPPRRRGWRLFAKIPTGARYALTSGIGDVVGVVATKDGLMLAILKDGSTRLIEPRDDKENHKG